MKTLSDYLNTIPRTTYDEAVKTKLLEYMTNKDFLEWVSSARITDRITGKKVESVCQLDYSDGEFEWTSSEAYLLDRYDMKVSDEFIDHVIKIEKPPAHEVT